MSPSGSQPENRGSTPRGATSFGRSSNGRTSDSGSDSEGSNPSLPAIFEHKKISKSQILQMKKIK